MMVGLAVNVWQGLTAFKNILVALMLMNALMVNIPFPQMIKKGNTEHTYVTGPKRTNVTDMHIFTNPKHANITDTKHAKVIDLRHLTVTESYPKLANVTILICKFQCQVPLHAFLMIPCNL